MFIQDRDLLALEPNLFRDVGWASQRRMQGVCDIVGTTLTLTSFDVDLEASGVDSGHVALVDEIAYEVTQRNSTTELTISRLRASTEDDPIPPTPNTNQALRVLTYAPQATLAHEQVLLLAGIDPDDQIDDHPTETDILNPESLKRVEALATLYLIFAAASSLSEPGSHLWARADMYRSRFARERERVVVRLDLDGDGVADATRRLNVSQLIRA